MSSFIHSERNYVTLRNGIYNLLDPSSMEGRERLDIVKYFFERNDMLIKDGDWDINNRRDIAVLITQHLADLQCSCVVLQYKHHYDMPYMYAVQDEYNCIAYPIATKPLSGEDPGIYGVYKMLQSIDYQCETDRLFERLPENTRTGMVYRKMYELLQFLKKSVAHWIISNAPEYEKASW